MTQVAGSPKYIQQEEIRFRSPISESTLGKFAQTNNYLLDHYPIPAGHISDFGGDEANIPAGWIVCDGRTVLKTAEPALYAAIGGRWGETLTHFNVPDLRGLFTRMVDTTSTGTANRDPDEGSRAPAGTGTAQDVGSYQADVFASHTHGAHGDGGAGSTIYSHYDPSITGFSNSSGTTTATGGSETRPKNAYVIKMIKT
jgi:microcystin-dependent protein